MIWCPLIILLPFSWQFHVHVDKGLRFGRCCIIHMISVNGRNMWLWRWKLVAIVPTIWILIKFHWFDLEVINSCISEVKINAESANWYCTMLATCGNVFKLGQYFSFCFVVLCGEIIQLGFIGLTYRLWYGIAWNAHVSLLFVCFPNFPLYSHQKTFWVCFILLVKMCFYVMLSWFLITFRIFLVQNFKQRINEVKITS